MIQPGETTTIAVSFTMKEGMGGPHRFDLLVDTDDALEPRQTVSVLAEFP